jgi:hypothetical protein
VNPDTVSSSFLCSAANAFESAEAWLFARAGRLEARSMIRSELRQFVEDVFGSVWTLEVLLLLKRHGEPLSLERVVTDLRASPSVVRQAVDSLLSAGLVLVEEPDLALYAPASAETRELVEEVETLYAQRPDGVRRIIISARVAGIAAFSDAFRLRRD